MKEASFSCFLKNIFTLNSHVVKHTLESGHSEITIENVKIINSNYRNYYKRKVSEALYIKQKKPFLNIQDTSVPLRLLN